MKDNTRYSNDIRYAVQLDAGELGSVWSDSGTSAADNITTSTTHVTGSKSISFDKVAGDVEATIIKTLNGGNGLDLRPFAINGRIGISIYISSLSAVASVVVYLKEDASNYVKYTVADSSLSAGWNHLSIDTITGTQTGDGVDWSAVKYVAIGVVFDNASDTLSDILLDHVIVDLPDVNVEIDSSSTLSVQVVNTPSVTVNGVTTVSGEVSILDQPLDVTGSTVTVTGEVNIAEDPLNVNVTNDVGLSDAVSPGDAYTSSVNGIVAMAVRDDELVPRASDDEFIPLMVNEDGALLTKSVGGSSVSPTQGSEYFSPVDFTVSYASSSGVELSGLSFTPESEQFLGLFAHTAGSGLRFYDPVTYEFDYDSSTGTLNVGGDVFLGSNDEFRVVVAGPQRAYSQAMDATQQYSVNPPWEQYTGFTLCDVTNGTDTTGTYYYVDMSGYNHASFQLIIDGGSGTVSGTIEATIQDDGTAASSCTYMDVTSSTFGTSAVTSSALLVDEAGKLGAYKYVRLKIESYTGGANDADWTCYVKQWYA